LDFVPERWTELLRDQTWTHNSKAWIPFQTGAYACAGKQLALNELRILVAKIVRNFDIIMPDDFDHAAFQDSIKAFQSIIMGPLHLQVNSRQQG
jgi:cytochrome P450